MKTDNRLDQDFLKNLTVLYVEDDGDTRMQFNEFLSRPVGTLITAANGMKGLEAFKKHAPDIVITDIHMPQMDGLTMAQNILEMVPSVPIIVVTAFEQADYLKRAINIGIDKYVTKPVNSYLLFECLLECARRLRAEQQLKLQHQREIQEEWSKHNATIASLAGGMAHDYKNLIQTILGYASLVNNKLAPDGEGSQYHEKISKCCAEAEVLGQMLRILGNDYEYLSSSGPVMPCIRTAIDQVLGGASIVFSCDYPEDLPYTRFSEQLIQLVFSGLATNALEAMPEGGSLLLTAGVVEITEDDVVPLAPGTYVHITMADSGVGIASEVLPKIFDPNFSTKRRSSKVGAGLSLALCRTAIMKSGGLITAESDFGNGSRFMVWLPADA